MIWTGPMIEGLLYLSWPTGRQNTEHDVDAQKIRYVTLQAAGNLGSQQRSSSSCWEMQTSKTKLQLYSVGKNLTHGSFHNWSVWFALGRKTWIRPNNNKKDPCSGFLCMTEDGNNEKRQEVIKCLKQVIWCQWWYLSVIVWFLIMTCGCLREVVQFSDGRRR